MILAHHFGRSMRERRRGGIIFSASIAGFAPISYWGNYSASKAYDLYLAEAMADELRKYNVDVLALCPGATHTEFANYRGIFAKLLAMGPDKVIDQALARLGKRNTTIVGLLNWLTVFSYRLVPRKLATLIAGRVIRDMVKH
jgi:short-subunit dehydrogenase